MKAPLIIEPIGKNRKRFQGIFWSLSVKIRAAVPGLGDGASTEKTCPTTFFNVVSG